MSELSARAMCPISRFRRIILYKLHLFSLWLQLCGLFDQMQSQEGEKKTRFAGHNFYWQLVNKLKKRDAGTNFPPPLFPLFRSVSTPLLPKTGAFPKIFLEVMDFSGAGNWLMGYISSKS